MCLALRVEVLLDRLPTSVFWPGEFYELYSPWSHKESDTTEQLSLSPLYHVPQILLPTRIQSLAETWQEDLTLKPWRQELRPSPFIHPIFTSQRCCGHPLPRGGAGAKPGMLSVSLVDPTRRERLKQIPHLTRCGGNLKSIIGSYAHTHPTSPSLQLNHTGVSAQALKHVHQTFISGLTSFSY